MNQEKTEEQKKQDKKGVIKIILLGLSLIVLSAILVTIGPFEPITTNEFNQNDSLPFEVNLTLENTSAVAYVCGSIKEQDKDNLTLSQCQVVEENKE